MGTRSRIPSRLTLPSEVRTAVRLGRGAGDSGELAVSHRSAAGVLQECIWSVRVQLTTCTFLPVLDARCAALEYRCNKLEERGDGTAGEPMEGGAE